MTTYGEGFRKERDWDGANDYISDCNECYNFEHNHCDSTQSNHYGHMLLPFHPACDKFQEKY